MALMAPKSRYLRKTKGRETRFRAAMPSGCCFSGVHDPGFDPGVALPFPPWVMK